MVELHTWTLVAYTMSTVAASATIVFLCVWLRRYRRLCHGLYGMNRELGSLVEALTHRGTIYCDDCLRPIAPGTPTDVEESESGSWRITHRHHAIG